MVALLAQSQTLMHNAAVAVLMSVREVLVEQFN